MTSVQQHSIKATSLSCRVMPAKLLHLPREAFLLSVI